LNSVGERQKSSDHDLSASGTERFEPFFKTSIIRLGALGSVLISSGIMAVSIGWNATDGSLISSLISLIV